MNASSPHIPRKWSNRACDGLQITLPGWQG